MKYHRDISGARKKGTVLLLTAAAAIYTVLAFVLVEFWPIVVAFSLIGLAVLYHRLA